MDPLEGLENLSDEQLAALTGTPRESAALAEALKRLAYSREHVVRLLTRERHLLDWARDQGDAADVTNELKNVENARESVLSKPSGSMMRKSGSSATLLAKAVSGGGAGLETDAMATVNSKLFTNGNGMELQCNAIQMEWNGLKRMERRRSCLIKTRTGRKQD